MAYKVKPKSRYYYSERMRRDTIEDYKKRHRKLPLKVVSRVGTETAFNIPKRTHQKGNLVDYKGHTYFVKNSSQKGLTLERVRYSEITKQELAKPLFVPEKEVQRHVELHPMFSFD